MDPSGGQGYGMGGDHQQSTSHPQAPQGNIPNFSFSNPLASMMSMMQGSPGVSDDPNKGQSRAPAKITMNIPSFLPKIQATSASTPGPKKPQEEITKSQQSSGPPSIPSIIPIPRSSPVSNSNVSTNVLRPTMAKLQSMPLGTPIVSIQYKSPRELLLTQGQSNTANTAVRSPGPASKQQSANPAYAVRQRQPGPSTNVALSSTNPMKTVHRAGPPGQRNVATAIRGSNPHNRSSPSSQPKVVPTLIARDPLQQPRKNPPLPPPEDPLSLCGDPLATEEAEMEDPLHPQKCDVPGCSHVKSPVISLFSIPQHGLASWCQILKIDLSHMSKGDISSLKICSEHFDLSQFVEGSACKELKPNAVPRPSAFSINAMTTIQTVRREPPVLNFVPVPIPAPIAEVPAVSSPDVTIQRIPAPVNPGIQQRSVNVPTQPTPSVRPRAPVPIPTASTAPSVPTQRHPPPAKVQILSVPAPTPTTAVIQPPPTEITSLSSTNTSASSLSMASIAQQVGIRKPGPSRGPRGRPRKNPINVVSTPSNSASRAPLTSASTSSLLKTSTTSNVEQVSPQQVKVAVGSYCRPTIKMKSENVKIDELANLVMPSEDWSVNIYPSFNKESKNQICTISETILNSDMVEIVKKSITVHSNWAMKFSILSKDMSHFNLGLAVTDISDLQAVLDNFNSLPCCKGLSDILTSKNYNVLSLQMKVLVERFVDNVFRSVNCPLLIIVNPEVGKAEQLSKSECMCKPCRNLLQNLAFLKSQ